MCGPERRRFSVDVSHQTFEGIAGGWVRFLEQEILEEQAKTLEKPERQTIVLTNLDVKLGCVVC